MYPILFQLGSLKINSYIFFNAVAMLAGGILYFNLTSREKNLQLEERMLLWAGALAGGFLGAKAIDLSLNYKAILADILPYLIQASGSRTVLGGIIGGYFGVKTAKRALGIRSKTGDPFALSALVAMGIGRIGCFLGGCCYGKAYKGWLSVHMAGDYRYPTQLMEMAFDLCLFLLLWRLRKSMRRPGDLFKLFILCYASFRFLIEFIRTEPVVWQGLTIYQLISIPLILLTAVYFYYNYARSDNE